jgi:hypothetical protein
VNLNRITWTLFAFVLSPLPVYLLSTKDSTNYAAMINDD